MGSKGPGTFGPRMAAEVVETSMSKASSAVVAVTAVVTMVAAAAVAVVQAGLFPQPRWRFPRAHRTSPLEYPRLLDVAEAPEAAVLRGADLCP